MSLLCCVVHQGAAGVVDGRCAVTYGGLLTARYDGSHANRESRPERGERGGRRRCYRYRPAWPHINMPMLAVRDSGEAVMALIGAKQGRGSNQERIEAKEANGYGNSEAGRCSEDSS